MSGHYPDALTQATFDEAQDPEARMSDEKSDEVNTSLDQISRGIDILADERDQLRSQLAAVTAERDGLEREYGSIVGDRAALACAVERLRGVLQPLASVAECVEDIPDDTLWVANKTGADPKQWTITARMLLDARAALSIPPSADAEAVRAVMQHFRGHDKECGVVVTGDDCTCGRDAAYFAPTLAWARPTGKGEG